jgi:hypothetical protein
MEDISERVFPKLLKAPAVLTTVAFTSAACDVRGYEGAAFAVIYGDSGDTLSASVYLTAKITECDTESGVYTDVATADIQIGATNSFGKIDAPTEDQAIFWIGYGGSKGWVKVVVTPTGTHTNGTIVGIFAIIGMPRTQTADGNVNP